MIDTNTFSSSCGFFGVDYQSFWKLFLIDWILLLEKISTSGRFPSQSKYFGLRLRMPKNRKPELSGRNVHTMPTTQDHFTWRESAKRKTHACQERHAQDSCASTRRTPTTRGGKRGWGVWERNEDDSRDWKNGMRVVGKCSNLTIIFLKWVGSTTN